MSDINLESTSFDVVFSSTAFSLEAIKRAAYVLMARATVTIKVSNAETGCSLTPTSPAEDIRGLERDFRREVLDQDLRISIEARTEPMRDAILGLTFSRTGLQG